jgi:hypothetical protein
MPDDPMSAVPGAPAKVPVQPTAFAPPPPTTDPQAGPTDQRPSADGRPAVYTAQDRGSPTSDEVPTAFTQRRAPVLEPAPSPIPEPPRRRGMSRGMAIVGLVAAVPTAIVIAVALSGGNGHSPKQADSTDKTNTPAQNAITIGAHTTTPGPVAARDIKFATHKVTRTRVKISWSYPKRRDDDYYSWRYSGSQNAQRVLEPAVLVTRRVGHRTCIQVQVQRNGGANALSLPWSKKECVS